MIYDTIDIDKSGTVEFKELAKWLVQQGEKPTSVQELFAKIDTDNSGSITRDEWKAGWARGFVTLGVAQAAAYTQE